MSQFIRMPDADLLDVLRNELRHGAQLVVTDTLAAGPNELYEKELAKEAIKELLQRR